jgi:hypothetical protein
VAAGLAAEFVMQDSAQTLIRFISARICKRVDSLPQITTASDRFSKGSASMLHFAGRDSSANGRLQILGSKSRFLLDLPAFAVASIVLF